MLPESITGSPSEGTAAPSPAPSTQGPPAVLASPARCASFLKLQMPLPIWLYQLQPHTLLPSPGQASLAEMQDGGSRQALLLPGGFMSSTLPHKLGWGKARCQGHLPRLLGWFRTSTPEAYLASWPGSHWLPTLPQELPGGPRMKPGHPSATPTPTPSLPLPGSSGWAQFEQGSEAHDFQAPPFGEGVSMPVSSALMPSFFPGETGSERAGDRPKVTQEFRPELRVSPYTHPAWPRIPESPGRASPAPTWPKAQAGIRPPPSPSHHPVRGRCHTGSGQRPPLPVPSKTSATRVQAPTPGI